VNEKKYNITLCRPQLAENVGAAARACAVMGFHELRVINPSCDILSQPALDLASHAEQVLREAALEKDLTSLINAEHFVVGFSARPRTMNVDYCSLPQLTDRLKTVSQKTIVLLFGAERTGLTNEELSYCHLHCYIPTFNEDYSSLNLAQAVQVVAYTLAVEKSVQPSLSQPENEQGVDNSLAKAFYHYLEQLIHEAVIEDFCHRTTPERTLMRLRLLFNKIVAQEDDIKFLFGFLKALRKGHD
jgi:TrmH family RNA methyltransferase